MDGARKDDKNFELALVELSEMCLNDWQLFAAECLQKPVEEVRKYYEDLVHDVNLIESGCVIVPDYVDYLSPTEASQVSEDEKKKGIAWTDEEHKNFLKGLEKYGRGDWKSIAIYSVMTRTATQVASHAQKYYQRQLPGSKVRKRSSIHDKTWVDTDDSVINEVPGTEFHPLHQTQYDDKTWVDGDHNPNVHYITNPVITNF